MADATPLDILWNGWRADYIQHVDIAGVPTESVFTRILALGLPDEQTFIVHRGALTFAILNAFPYAPGHTLVLPYREVPDITDLTPEESSELWSTVTAAVVAARAAYQPGGVNVGINLGRPAGGSVREHVHVHVVPRWVGDGNFMTAVANTRTIPETLFDAAAKLRAAWPRS